MNSMGPPVPELPVADVERAQQHYRDALGFKLEWLYPGKGIGAVSRDKTVIFFRKREPPFEPAIHWMFAEDIDASYQELMSLGANIVEPLEKNPWGLRQFTVKDLDGNLFYFHHDLRSGWSRPMKGAAVDNSAPAEAVFSWLRRAHRCRSKGQRPPTRSEYCCADAEHRKPQEAS